MRRVKVFKILNVLEPILCILFEVFVLLLALIMIKHTNFGSTVLSGNYTIFEKTVMYALPVLIVITFISEIYMFFNITLRFKIYTLIYALIEAIIMYILWKIYPLAALASIFLFNIIKCICRYALANIIMK